MNKLTELFTKYGYITFLCIVAITLLFSLGSCIYTAIVNPFVGITGIVGTVAGLAAVGYNIYKEIKTKILQK